MDSKQISQIVEAAEVAAPVFEAQGWTWGSTDKEKHTPGVAEIAAVLHHFIEDADSTTRFVTSGRLAVKIDKEEVGLFLSLGHFDQE